jgi:hypothetical protein
LQIADFRLQIDCRLAVAMLAVVVLEACAGAERPLLERFFGASRLRDRTALQAISTVIFEPREQGIVRTFTITSVTPEHSRDGTATKDVTIAAPVVLPDGQTVQKTLVVTLQRASGERAGRWLVTGVRDAAAPEPAPRS